MRTDITMYSVRSNKFNQGGSKADYQYQFTVKRGMLPVEVSHGSISREIEVRVYCLEVKVFRVDGGRENEELDVNFGALTQRQRDMHIFIDKLTNMTPAPQMEQLLSMAVKLRVKEKPKFKKEALLRLKKELDVYGFSPFNRDELEGKGFLESAVTEEDEKL